jgi:hypothetical protein
MYELLLALAIPRQCPIGPTLFSDSTRLGVGNLCANCCSGSVRRLF